MKLETQMLTKNNLLFSWSRRLIIAQASKAALIVPKSMLSSISTKWMGVSNDNDNCPLKGQCYIRNQVAHCLKITENVSFNFASEASYMYIVDKSSLKMPKMANLAIMEKIKCDIFSDFQTLWTC